MQKQIMIIGLGQFGMSLARALSAKDAEVIAIDINPDLVDEAAAFTTDAVCLDATDENALAKFHPEERDAVICAIGNREASILCTALLRQMGAKYICSRYLDDMHKRVLKAVGAQTVLNPEQEIGQRFANHIIYQSVITDSDLSSGIQMTEIRALPFMHGKSLSQLALPNKFGLIVAAIRHGNSPKLERPNPLDIISEDDKLLLICDENNLTKLLKSVNQ